MPYIGSILPPKLHLTTSTIKNMLNQNLSNRHLLSPKKKKSKKKKTKKKTTKRIQKKEERFSKNPPKRKKKFKSKLNHQRWKLSKILPKLNLSSKSMFLIMFRGLFMTHPYFHNKIWIWKKLKLASGLWPNFWERKYQRKRIRFQWILFCRMAKRTDLRFNWYLRS